MTDIRLIGETRDRRQLYLAQLTRLDDWPTQLEEPARPFVVFTAFDAKRLTDNELLQFARQLLDQGCIYACSWGPEALRVETLSMTLPSAPSSQASGMWPKTTSS